jgi:hypothetical protein
MMSDYKQTIDTVPIEWLRIENNIEEYAEIFQINFGRSYFYGSCKLILI